MGWHQTAIDEALAGMGDRAEHEATGRAMTRREVMAMVSKLGIITIAGASQK